MGKHNKKGSVYAQNKKVASSSKQQVVLPKRLTFTALEKLRIIDEVERSNDAQAVLQKYGSQPRSFQRWKCDRSKLEKQVAKGSTSKRTIRTDPLRRIKEIVTNYISANKTTIRVTGQCIKTRALLAKDHLLQRHAQQPFLSDTEVKAMMSFKAASGWCNEQQKLAFGGSKQEKIQSNQHIVKVMTINGDPHHGQEIYYNPDEENPATKSMGVLRVGKDLVNDITIHKSTKSSSTGSPRACLDSRLMEKLNPPLVDDSRGEVVKIEFGNGMTNTIFFAKETSQCPLLRKLYAHVEKYKSKLVEMIKAVPTDLWEVDCLAGGHILSGGIAMRNGSQGSSPKLPFLRHESTYTIVKEIHNIYATIAGLEALIIDKYCPSESMKNHEIYRGGEDCIYPSPMAQRKGQVMSEGLHWNLQQIAIRIMSNECECPEQLQALRTALHIDQSDVDTHQPLTFFSVGGEDGKGGRVIDSDLMVFEHPQGGQSYRLRTSLANTVVVGLINSARQLHGNAYDVERSGFERGISCIRFIPYGRDNVLNFIRRRREGKVSGMAALEMKVMHHRPLEEHEYSDGDVVSARFGKSEAILAATLIKGGDDYYFRWHSDNTFTPCRRSSIFSQHCAGVEPHNCDHCNPSFEDKILQSEVCTL